jgi:lysyl-tRNA synthetase class 2
LRSFFDERGYLEVDTPLLSPDLIPESSIEIFKTNRLDINGGMEEFYLIPSPEIWMKKLLAGGSGSIYQICKSFRNSEQSGRLHRNEFTMLEWYGVGLDYKDNISLTGELFKSLAPLAQEGSRHYFEEDFLILSMDEAFCRYAGFSLLENSSISLLSKQLDRLELPYNKNDNKETLYNRLFLTLVEPALPEDRTVVLTEYPSFVPTLAKTEPGSPFSERWELYIKGIELANCFSEETSPERIARYFEKEGVEKSKALVPHNVDKDFSLIFNEDYPRVSGVALGVDRLLMSLCGAGEIDEVLLFP